MSSAPRSRRPVPRHRRAVYRRRRLVLGLVTAAVFALILVLVVPGGWSPGHGRRPAQAAPSASARGAPVVHDALPPPAVEAGLMPWSLPSPLSRMVVLPGAGGLLIAGGLTPGQTSSGAVSVLDRATGAVRPAGVLPSGVHDAAGAVIGGSDVVFGGGDSSTTAAVEVLATRDSRKSSVVATLPVPVRYPAVATLGGAIYVFGGQATGPQDSAVDLIQRVDPATHKAAVVGHLPYPLEGAAAASLGGTVYLAGGDSPSAPPGQPGVGTTQLDGWASASGPATPGLAPVADVWAFNPSTDQVTRAGTLQVPVAHAGVAVQGNTAWLIGGESGSTVVGTVQALRPNPSFGLAGQAGAGSPYFGDELLVADRGNNRLLLFDAQMRVLWTSPSPTSQPDPLGFYFPDDAFFAKHGTVIISNQEENETIIQIAFPSGKVVWSFGHPKVPSRAPGHLHEPDDAYLLRNGQITVADAQNCRVLVINPTARWPTRSAPTEAVITTPRRRWARPTATLPYGTAIFSCRRSTVPGSASTPRRDTWCGQSTSPSPIRPTPTRWAPPRP